MSDKHNSLEDYLVAKFKELDSTAHKVAGSGAGDKQKGDISNKYCCVEAKIKHTQENIIVDWKKEWLKTNDQMPINSKKFPIIVTENKYGCRFVTLTTEEFFKLLRESKL